MRQLAEEAGSLLDDAVRIRLVQMCPWMLPEWRAGLVGRDALATSHAEAGQVLWHSL